ncbi:MAG TPA: amino acid permease [Anaerolineae bacterium]
MLARMESTLSRLRQRLDSENGDQKLGTFAGVFTPTVLTILGVIMYLRLGRVVGNAGLVGAILIILLAHVITISTGLSVSSIVTNTRVGAGGAFAIISQSLGLEVGGSVGIPLFLAQGISIALYVFGFAEAWVSIFPSHPFALVTFVTFALVFVIAYASTQFAARTQFLILAIVILSLISIFLASFPIAGRPGLTETPVIFGEYPSYGNFWSTFAVFFPAVTGIMVGISLSGALREPRKAIPKGTLSAIALTLVVYLALTYWLARIATPEELVANETIMVDKALFSWAVLAGVLGATFSSALGSLVAAPRVMQALALHGILPFSRVFVKETESGEPRQAMIATGVLGLAALVSGLAGGGLDAIAGVITMFFLITYGMLNVVVLIEQTLNMVSFRPTLQVPRIVPFIGMVGCIFVMFLINPGFSLVAVILVLVLYGYLARQHLKALESDVRSGLFSSVAEWSVVKASSMPAAPERTWKPVVLAPVTTTGELTGSYRFLQALTAPQGVIHVLGIYSTGSKAHLKDLNLLTQAFGDDGIYARLALLESEDFTDGVRASTQVLRQTFFRPNILFLRLWPDSNVDKLQQLIDKTAAYSMGIVLLARHPIIALGREKRINVWISDQAPDWQHDLRQSNLDLAVLTAYQLAQNWKGHINLCMAVKSAETCTRAETFLAQLVSLARLPPTTQVLVFKEPFMDALVQAPRADLNTFGLSRRSDLAFSQQIVATVDTSCVFVRDSGEESALA